MKNSKLATRLEQQLVRLFLAASATLGVLVAVGFYIVNVQTQEAASHFISMHVKSLVAAGINSQSVSEIDREVRRLYFAWMGAQKTYQKSDIRIAVSIDGVLVGRAGPLKPFGWLSASAKETERLSSGQVMILKTETDFSQSAIWVGVLILTLGASFYVGFLVLRRLLAQNIQSLTAPLEDRMSWLAQVSLRLPESVRDAVLPEDSSVTEVAELDRSLNAFVRQILRLEARVKEAGINEGRVEVADRVAHALKGKLAILRLRIENTQSLSSEEKRKLRDSVNGLMMSSKDMLESGRVPALSENLEASMFDLVEHAVGRRDRIKMSFVGDRKNGIVLSPTAASGFEDAIIAILDNALEASRDFVHVRCESSIRESRIEITDSGRGIPAEILPRLMRERATFGKRDGNGLGLFHAAKAVKGVGGTMEIKSKENVGTTVVIAVANQVRLRTQNVHGSQVFETAN